MEAFSHSEVEETDFYQIYVAIFKDSPEDMKCASPLLWRDIIRSYPTLRVVTIVKYVSNRRLLFLILPTVLEWASAHPQ